jgi:hypothetical protein
MTNPLNGWGFGQLRADLIRCAAIERDNQGHWLREWAVAQWAAGSVFPAAIERWVHEIGEEAKWKA